MAKAIVDPILAERGIVSTDQLKLTGGEARTALFYLEMQWRDENTAKGLTRSCYEALVKVALRGTDSEHRISREEVYERVRDLLPHYSIEQLKPFVDTALGRLSKQAIRHWPKLDEFNLSFEELQRIGDSAAGIELLRSDFKKEILTALTEAEGVTIRDIDAIAELTISLVEKLFLRRGEEFAACVARDTPPEVNEIDLKDVIVANLPAKVDIKGRNAVSVLQSVISNLLNSPSSATAEYVNILSDAYTLFAFLAETPDVQAVTKKLFSYGEIWLDTSVILPVIAEQAYPEGLRPFATMLLQARKIGLKLLITPGIIEEIERHLNRCVVYDKSPSWEGRVPFVYGQYALAGRPTGGFRAWAEQFFGNQNPEKDIADYLSGEFGVELEEIPPESYATFLRNL
ncbi:hypothetical protein LRP30_34060 [Bradyrhizobium sp. C-145]|uniref:hypothetical protein n=1 Tax=Bradyrhizobium sp. C-145 TaxID=574727 RepID=UPI00201B4E91|nr:hypothetical protein [Bradyrhizobium sp. C-145]UQR61782.1 hypothetical protein LRP30_34060 [Bradyrhizobium sp. C-145]